MVSRHSSCSSAKSDGQRPIYLHDGEHFLKGTTPVQTNGTMAVSGQHQQFVTVCGELGATAKQKKRPTTTTTTTAATANVIDQVGSAGVLASSLVSFGLLRFSHGAGLSGLSCLVGTASP